MAAQAGQKAQQAQCRCPGAVGPGQAEEHQEDRSAYQAVERPNPVAGAQPKELLRAACSSQGVVVRQRVDAPSCLAPAETPSAVVACHPSLGAEAPPAWPMELNLQVRLGASRDHQTPGQAATPLRGRSSCQNLAL